MKPLECKLTKREKEILLLLAEGKSRKMIAPECNISKHTVDWHIKNIYVKLDVNRANAAVVKALRLGLLCLS